MGSGRIGHVSIDKSINKLILNEINRKKIVMVIMIIKVIERLITMTLTVNSKTIRTRRIMTEINVLQ